MSGVCSVKRHCLSFLVQPAWGGRGHEQ